MHEPHTNLEWKSDGCSQLGFSNPEIVQVRARAFVLFVSRPRKIRRSSAWDCTNTAEEGELQVVTRAKLKAIVFAGIAATVSVGAKHRSPFTKRSHVA